MLKQNLIQVYKNSEGDAVVLVGVFTSIGENVDVESVVIDIEDAKKIAKALIDLAEDAGY